MKLNMRCILQTAPRVWALCFLIVALCGLSLGIAGSVMAQTQYTITDLGTLGGSMTSAQGINNSGQVIGYALNASGYWRAFHWQDGAMNDLGTLGGSSSWASDINNADQVVGRSFTDSGESRVFLWLPSPAYDFLDGMHDIGVPNYFDHMASINDLGQIVGDTQPGIFFLWLPSPAYDLTAGAHLLGPQDGSISSATRINNTGLIAGSIAGPGESYSSIFSWQNGVITLLPELPGGNGSGPWGINDSGDIVGNSSSSYGQHPTLWRNGIITDLGTLGGSDGNANGINNLGQAVGGAQTGSGKYHAFLWQNGVMKDLNDLIPSGSGWDYLRVAFDTNDAGQIVGDGYVNGQLHAFLLTPTVAIPLTITCPPDVTAYTGPDATGCGTVVSDATLGTASASGGSDPVTISRSGIPAGNLFPVGTTTIIYTATDAAGNTASGTQTVTVIDNTPPVITVPSDILATATSSAGASVTYTVSATDNCDGSVTATPPSASTFPLGTTTVTCTATDGAGNMSTETFYVNVTYSWSGFLQPINTDSSSVFKAGSTVPVKFQLTGASAGITDAVARLYYAKVSDGVVGDVNEAVSTAAATTGNLFRYDAISQQYIFNWSTKGLTVGTYQLQIDLGDGVTRTVNLGLK